MVLAAQSDAAALDQLLARYWRPVFAYLRALGTASDEAADLTQAFVADVLLHRNLIARAEIDRGSFRGYLKVALKNFLIDARRRESARKQAQQHVVVPASADDRAHADAVDAEAPADAFDRLWAETVMNEALSETRAHLVETGFGKHWHVFESRIVAPITSGNDARSMQDLAEEIGVDSPEDVSRLLFSAKRRFRNTLRRLVSETLTAETDPDDELDVLLGVLQSR